MSSDNVGLQRKTNTKIKKAFDEVEENYKVSKDHKVLLGVIKKQFSDESGYDLDSCDEDSVGITEHQNTVALRMKPTSNFESRRTAIPNSNNQFEGVDKIERKHTQQVYTLDINKR